MKAVFFDLDDTLYDRKLPFVEAFFQLDEKKASVIDTGLFHRTFVKRGNEVFDASASGRMTMEEMYTYRFCNAARDLGLSYTREEAMAFQNWYEESMKHIHLGQAVEEMLQNLSKKQVKMGVITNGPSEHQRVKMRSLGLQRWIPEENWLISGDYRAPKPELRMFRIAETLTGEESGDILYVGDSYERDIVPAKSAGWKAMWLNARGLLRLEEQKEPDYEADSEEMMKNLVCSLFQL